MTMLNSGIRQECRLTLRHIERLLKSADKKTLLRDIVQGICYLTDINYISEARNEWGKLTKNTIDDYIIVPSLPRNARIEWSVWAHRDNSRFECKYFNSIMTSYFAENTFSSVLLLIPKQVFLLELCKHLFEFYSFLNTNGKISRKLSIKRIVGPNDENTNVQDKKCIW